MNVRELKTENREQKTNMPFSTRCSTLCSLTVVLCALYSVLSSHFSYAQEFQQVQEINPSEVENETHSRVIVREHPKTGHSYISIISDQAPMPVDPLTNRNKYSRPDYRMLDPKAKKSDYPYDGPYSDRTKVYIFGATLIAGGITGGALGMAAAPAATGAAAASSGGGGAYLAGAGVLAGAGGVAVSEATKIRPEDENFIHEGESKTIEKGQSPKGVVPSLPKEEQ